MNLDTFSLICIYAAMAVYALSFIAFAFDLARRTTTVREAAVLTPTVSAVQRRKAAEQGSTITATAPPVGPGASATGTPYRSALSGRLALILMVVAYGLHLVGTVTRGIDAERVPWANMYEFAMTGTVLIMTVYLVVLTRIDLKFLGTFMTGLVTVLLGVATANFYVSVVPLPPALQSYWLVIHVFVASLSTALFALGFALSLLQLWQSRRETFVLEAKAIKLNFLATLPSSERLENLAYRMNIVGFIFWTFTLIAGAIWAEHAWGRYWGWDTKEVWTFIIWVIYAGYIHARATRGWRGSRSAWLAIVGFVAVMFNFSVVNLFFKGLHAYSGL